MKKKDSDMQLEEIVEAADYALSLSDIENACKNPHILNKYQDRYKGQLYSMMLMTLTHENFTEDDAQVLWCEIVEHMEYLDNMLGRPVGIAVASLDYLSNIKHELNEPVIIEEDKSEFITEATTKDELTNLYLRSVFDVMLKKELDEAKRKLGSLCLLLIDIDDFKSVNDNYGHQLGDQVLNKIGNEINNTVREMDTAARYGGEEISVIMPSSDINEAKSLAERIRSNIEGLCFTDFNVTISVGVSSTSECITTIESLIKSADDALYQAKARGKNQVVISSGCIDSNDT